MLNLSQPEVNCYKFNLSFSSSAKAVNQEKFHIKDYLTITSRKKLDNSVTKFVPTIRKEEMVITLSTGNSVYHLGASNYQLHLHR